MMIRRIAEPESAFWIVTAGSVHQTHLLQATSERFVPVHLIASTIQLYLVPCWVSQVCVDGLVVEPGTIARFPFQPAHHAELGGAATGHVVAAFFELHHG
jgi:hypothetical protein